MIKKTEQTFFDSVYDIVIKIPVGRVTTYGMIAKALGSSMSARMVGWAMNASHKSKKKIPAHRVVNRNGLLSGKHHFGSPDMMQKLLEKEGVIIKKDKIIDFENIVWNPLKELI